MATKVGERTRLLGGFGLALRPAWLVNLLKRGVMEIPTTEKGGTLYQRKEDLPNY